MPRAAFVLALLLTGGSISACGGSSKSKGSPSSDGGRGGSNAVGGGAGSGAGGAVAGGSGTGAGGVTGEAGSGTGEAGAATGGAGGGAASGGESQGGSNGAAAAAGASGEAGSHAGASAGGAGGCQDWCSAETPACCRDDLSCVESAPSCRIEVLGQSVDVIYEYAELQAEIDALSGGIAATIALSEVEHAAVDPAPAARFELTLNADASAELAALVGMNLQPFRVACDGQELFVGVMYMREGAAAIRTPVLHAEAVESGALVLRLGAWQGAWLFSDSDGDEASRERIDRAELRAEFCARGILTELE